MAGEAALFLSVCGHAQSLAIELERPWNAWQASCCLVQCCLPVRQSPSRAHLHHEGRHRLQPRPALSRGFRALAPGKRVFGRQAIVTTYRRHCRKRFLLRETLIYISGRNRPEAMSHFRTASARHAASQQDCVPRVIDGRASESTHQKVSSRVPGRPDSAGPSKRLEV